jgi:hypothetical protein
VLVCGGCSNAVSLEDGLWRVNWAARIDSRLELTELSIAAMYRMVPGSLPPLLVVSGIIFSVVSGIEFILSYFVINLSTLSALEKTA